MRIPFLKNKIESILILIFLNHYFDWVSLVDWSSLKENDSKNRVDFPNDAEKDSVNDFASDTS
jgi:hypothetical protein